MKKITFMLAICMIASTFAGCGNKKAEGKGKDKLTWWTTNYAVKYVENYGNVEAYKKIQEKTGIDIEFVHANVNQMSEQFNIMVSSGDMADIIDYNYTYYPGGVAKAIKDKIIITIDDYVKEGKTPNLSKIFKENPEIEKGSRNFDGTLALFPSLKQDISINAYFGPMIREDWLKKLGLEIPTGIEEWHTVLTAFKNNDPNGNGEADEIPLVADKNAQFSTLAAAYGVTNNFCLKNGEKVVYGPMEPEFKEFLAEMNKWYNEGLIDKEFAALTQVNVDSRITSDVGGAFVGYSGSQMGNYIAAKKGEDVNFKLSAAPWPSANGGKGYSGLDEMARLVSNGQGAGISSTNKNVEKTIKLLDYCYSDEATELQNWGIEGKTYTKENGKNKFTDDIVNNPDGKDPMEAISRYALPIYGSGGKIMDSAAYNAIGRAYDEQKAAADTWSKADLSLLLPTLVFTMDETEVIADVMGDITSYYNEMLVKIITGVEPVSMHDEFVKKIKDMNIEKAIKAYRTAYDRYKKN